MTETPYCTGNAGVPFVDLSAAANEQIAMVLDDFHARMTVGCAIAGQVGDSAPMVIARASSGRFAALDAISAGAPAAEDALAPALNCRQLHAIGDRHLGR